jgi:hypothetical protein
MDPSSESAQPAENPYASPRSVEIRSDAQTLLNATTKLYRRMGWAGAVYCVVFYPVLMIMEFAEGRLEAPEAIGGNHVAFDDGVLPVHDQDGKGSGR